jgi:hypothetical protein
VDATALCRGGLTLGRSTKIVALPGRSRGHSRTQPRRTGGAWDSVWRFPPPLMQTKGNLATKRPPPSPSPCLAAPAGQLFPAWPRDPTTQVLLELPLALPGKPQRPKVRMPQPWPRTSIDAAAWVAAPLPDDCRNAVPPPARRPAGAALLGDTWNHAHSNRPRLVSAVRAAAFSVVGEQSPPHAGKCMLWQGGEQHAGSLR